MTDRCCLMQNSLPSGSVMTVHPKSLIVVDNHQATNRLDVFDEPSSILDGEVDVHPVPGDLLL